MSPLFTKSVHLCTVYEIYTLCYGVAEMAPRLRLVTVNLELVLYTTLGIE